MKREMSISHTTQTYQVTAWRGNEVKEGERPVSCSENVQIKRINFMGRDSKQNVEASVQKTV